MHTSTWFPLECSTFHPLQQSGRPSTEAKQGSKPEQSKNQAYCTPKLVCKGCFQLVLSHMAFQCMVVCQPEGITLWSAPQAGRCLCWRLLCQKLADLHISTMIHSGLVQPLHEQHIQIHGPKMKDRNRQLLTGSLASSISSLRLPSSKPLPPAAGFLRDAVRGTPDQAHIMLAHHEWKIHH